VEQNLHIIAKHLEQIEATLDGERGLHHRAHDRDRDTEVWEDWQGYRAEQVAEVAPWLGTSARTIERARERQAELRRVKVRLVDGVILRPLRDDEITILETQGISS
jgi:hypothetical protein